MASRQRLYAEAQRCKIKRICNLIASLGVSLGPNCNGSRQGNLRTGTSPKDADAHGQRSTPTRRRKTASTGTHMSTATIEAHE